MSKDASGLPGIVMAVKHLVWVFEGAPGPVQEAANAVPAVMIETTPNTTGADAPERYASRLDCLDMSFSLKVRYPTVGFPAPDWRVYPGLPTRAPGPGEIYITLRSLCKGASIVSRRWGVLNWPDQKAGCACITAHSENELESDGAAS